MVLILPVLHDIPLVDLGVAASSSSSSEELALVRLNVPHDVADYALPHGMRVVARLGRALGVAVGADGVGGLSALG